MIFVALSEAADRGELILVDGGMCRWHRRRDGVVVIREILVVPSCRGLGVGRGMLETVKAINPGAVIRAACPAEYPSNGFWEHLGFRPTARTERTNTWELAPSNSSTARTATASSPTSP